MAEAMGGGTPVVATVQEKESEKEPSSPYKREMQLETTYQKSQSKKMPFIGQDDRLIGIQQARDGKEVLVQGSPEKKKTVRFDGNEIDLAKEELMKDPDHKIFINNPPTLMGKEKTKEDARGSMAEFLHVMSHHKPKDHEKRKPPAQVEKDADHYSNKLLDEVTAVNVGSPLQVNYQDSPITMYNTLKIQ